MTAVVHRVEVGARNMAELTPEMNRLVDAGWSHIDCVAPQLKALKPASHVVAAFAKEVP
jgi:hypothetical protein